MLELRGVCAQRGGTEVLRDVDLAVAEGEAVGVLGPNGAGKSSLLRVICGLLAPSGGRVTFEGRDLNAMAPEGVARAGVALVPEGRQVFATLSVAENLRLGGLRAGGDQQMGLLLERFPILAERAGERAGRLSGGEQQQLAIARALAGRPRLLVLDEPSMGLAPKMIDQTYELLELLRSEGLTILLVEQNVARTIEFCEHSVVMSRGSVRARGGREVLRGDTALLHAYLGRQI